MLGMWIREFLPELAGLFAIALWTFLMTPVLLKLSGVPISINPMKRRKIRLSLRQNLLNGVFGWGVGMILFGLTMKYVGWKQSGNSSDQPTLAGLGGLILKWTIGGILFGLFMHLSNGKRENSQPDQAS
jgi:hypothetical protein